MCPRCGHRSNGAATVVVGDLPIFGRRSKGMIARAVRRTVAVLLVGVGAAALLVLARLVRPESTHPADDKEEQCHIIQENGEDYYGELAKCQADLAYLRAWERGR
jgi:hypothetical protein